MLMEKLPQERLICAMMAVAAAERFVETTMTYCKQTIVSGMPISASQTVQFALVEMTTEVKMARAFVDKVISDYTEGKHVVAEISMAKYRTTEIAKQVADQCLDIFANLGMLEKMSHSKGVS